MAIGKTIGQPGGRPCGRPIAGDGVSSGSGDTPPSYAVVNRDGGNIVNRDGAYIVADPTPRTS